MTPPAKKLTHPRTPLDSYVITQGTLKGPWKGEFEEVEKMYSFPTPQIETERERERGEGWTNMF